ncbi:dihydrofolate reductase family protein [Asanoa iriomotensis]|uniref:Dihydrofolate reductase n=1 Tax=Asanoa iriomotensis TaxID=234613 RepID=A0ABQ4BWA3_9ACTN|nr:dihydrofolate reductase family protein [Asanoa iriomotensis]GIF54817.1 dihydrofolate reductase [Asanoa iriomotensis]
MRTITIGQFMSLDGVVEEPDKWHSSYVDDDLLGAMSAERIDTMLLGRVTYESFAGAFGELPDDHPAGAYMNRPEKIVVSRSLSTLSWRRSTLLPEGDVVERVAELKEGDGGPIFMPGSITLSQTLLRAGLVDRISLLVHPIVVGHGRRLFPESMAQVPFTLERCDVFGSGVTYQVYAVR